LVLKLLANKKGARIVRAEVWGGDRKQVATVKSVATEIKNMISGVQFGYKFEMKFVYAHFPINCNITNKKDQIEARSAPFLLLFFCARAHTRYVLSDPKLHWKPQLVRGQDVARRQG
jgi:ribosomal protein L6P/L9E